MKYVAAMREQKDLELEIDFWAFIVIIIFPQISEFCRISMK